MGQPSSVKAVEGPLAPPGEGDFPSILTFQLRPEARKEAHLWKTICFFFGYDVLCVGVFVHVGANVLASTGEAGCYFILLYFFSQHAGVNMYPENKQCKIPSRLK